MKRDKSLMWRLLAKLESLPLEMGDVLSIQPTDGEVAIDGYTPDQIEYHLNLLREGNYIECPGSQPMLGITFSGLTERGHDFVEEGADQQPKEQVSRPLAGITEKQVEDLFGQYEELANNVERSTHQFFVGNLQLWFKLLDSSTLFAQPIIQLEAAAPPFLSWFAPYRQAMNGIGIPPLNFEWPSERTKQLGLKLHLLRRFANGDIEPRTFALTVMHTGANADNGISAINAQLFHPLANDLRRYLGETTDQAAFAKLYLPASDRFVALDHNGETYLQTLEQLAELERAVEQSNDYSDPEDKEQKLAELSAGKRLLLSVRVRPAAVATVLRSPLAWLSDKFTDNVIGRTAGAVWEGIKLLFGF